MKVKDLQCSKSEVTGLLKMQNERNSCSLMRDHRIKIIEEKGIPQRENPRSLLGEIFKSDT